MLKKRVIFTLLYSQGNFYLSRNFRLQKVGDLRWLNENYNFSSVSSAIDELVILNVSRDQIDWEDFYTMLKEMTANIFVPISIGGGIRNIDHASTLLRSGADKLVLNTSLNTDPTFVKQLIQIYGSQCIIASVDFRNVENKIVPFVLQGRQALDLSLKQYLEYVCSLGVGEIYLNSIDKDGTGQGYALKELKSNIDTLGLPIIIAGGAGHAEHLHEGLEASYIDAVATAHLFNFMGSGLSDARKFILNLGVKLPCWST